MSLYIGLMSGTSMDGIDAVLVDSRGPSLVEALHCPYSLELTKELSEAQKQLYGSFAAFDQLHTRIGREFAQATQALLHKAKTMAKAVKAIGSHGQTLCHDANALIPYTIQLGCAHTIAETTGITVVADFRTRDLVVGGQGAPFAPLYHQACFKHLAPVVVVNIGGIANLSYLADAQQLFGHDTGPGNCLLDAWALRQLKQPFDSNGSWGATGKTIGPLLDRLLQDPYFKKRPPKSIGKEHFSLDWLMRHGAGDHQPQDIQATLVQLTAATIVCDVHQLQAPIQQLLVCGGGVHNHTLMRSLSQLLPNIQVTSTALHGHDPDYIEAQMMAWLAEKALKHLPLDLNAITGAKKSAILGAIYPAGIDNGFRLEV